VPENQTLEFFDSAFLRKLEALVVFSRKVFAGRLRGEQRSRKHGASVEFADFRPYSQGDDFRRIDWNAYARFENLFLKLFTEEEDLFVYLLVDRSASMAFGEPAAKFDLARRIAAALSYIALANLDRVTVMALAYDADPAGELPPAIDVKVPSAGTAARTAQDHLAFARGKGAIFSVFDFLRQLRPAGLTDLRRSARDFLTRYRHKGVVVLISDFLSPGGYEDALSQLAVAGYQPMTIQILAPNELQPDISGDFRLIDSETGRPIDISTTKHMLDAYRARARRFVDDLSQFCKSRNIACVQTTAEADFEELILRYLRRAALLK